MTVAHLVMSLLAFLVFVAIGLLVGFKSRSSRSVWAWSLGIPALATVGSIAEGIMQPGSFSLMDTVIGLVEVAALIAGPAFVVRALRHRKKQPHQ